MKLSHSKSNIKSVLSDLTCESLLDQLKARGLFDARFTSFAPMISSLFELFDEYKVNHLEVETLKPKPFVLGVLAPLGAGKTLISRYVCMLFEHLRHIKAQSISIDDFYLSFEERKSQGIKYRGPPGTHDMRLLARYFDDIHDLNQLTLHSPVFDKGLHQGQGDRTGVFEIQKPDMVVFEGWLTGLRSVPSIHTESNSKLKDYEQFWDKLDALVVLRPESFEYSYTWRAEAEKMNKSGQMSQDTIREFVSFFIESLDPDIYYSHLQQNAPHFSYPVILADIDFSHKATSFRLIHQNNMN